MLDRAEQGVQWAREGKGYIPDPEVWRPVMASQIIANNVQVTFAAFAFGALAGLGTLFLLVTNGIFLGGVAGIGTLLLAFVAPHGVLELTAIAIAGGAGLLLAKAIWMPGARSRREALVDEESIKRFRAGYREGFGAHATQDPLYQAVSDGRRLAGMEHWLPLFEEKLSTLFDHLSEHDLVLRDSATDQALDARREAIADYYANRQRTLSGEAGSSPVTRGVRG